VKQASRRGQLDQVDHFTPYIFKKFSSKLAQCIWDYCSLLAGAWFQPSHPLSLFFASKAQFPQRIFDMANTLDTKYPLKPSSSPPPSLRRNLIPRTCATMETRLPHPPTPLPSLHHDIHRPCKYRNVKIEGMLTDLDMKGNAYNIALIAYAVPFILLELPSSLALRRYRPGNYIAFIMFGWGE